MVQIYGSLTPTKLSDGDMTTRSDNCQQLASEKSSSFSSSPVIVRSKKDFSDLFKK